MFCSAVGNSQSGVSEAEAMRRILATEGIHERVWIDQDPIHVRGTPFQLKTVERIFSHTLPSYPKQLILVAHPLHLPRAIWLFRRAFPKVQFLLAASQQVYDTTVSQRRLHSRWRFLLWNGLAWIHHLLAAVASGDTKTPFIKSSSQ